MTTIMIKIMIKVLDDSFSSFFIVVVIEVNVVSVVSEGVDEVVIEDLSVFEGEGVVVEQPKNCLFGNPYEYN